MYNTFEYNTTQYNRLAQLIGSQAPEDDVSFCNFGLNNDEIRLKDLIYETAPTRDLNTFDNPFNDGRTLVSEFWREDKIIMTGSVVLQDQCDLEAKLDEITRAISVPECELKIVHDCRDRIWIASLSNTDIFRRARWPRCRADFRFEFTVFTPFGEDRTFSSFFLPNSTFTTFRQVINNEGSVKTPLRMLFVVNSATNFTNINVRNLTNNQTINLLAPPPSNKFVVTDVIEINSITKQCKLNGVVIDYTGRFIDLEVGNNEIDLTLTSTSHNLDITFLYKNRYLI